eukprot:1712602-Rhodomonas_salina.2
MAPSGRSACFRTKVARVGQCPVRPSNDPQIRVPSGLSTPLKAGIGIVFVFLNSGLCVNQSADEGILKILQLFNKACSALEMTAKQALDEGEVPPSAEYLERMRQHRRFILE